MAALFLLRFNLFIFTLLGLIYVVGVVTIPITIVAVYFFWAGHKLALSLAKPPRTPALKYLKSYTYSGLFMAVAAGLSFWLLTGLECLDICADSTYVPIVHHHQLINGIVAFVVSVFLILLPIWLIKRSAKA